jgi:hypothetical protein
MDVKRRVSVLLSSTIFSAAVLAAAPACANDSQNQQLQNQINAMQQQLQALQNQLAQTKQQAAAAQQAVANIPAGVYDQAPAGAPMVTKGPPSWRGGIHMSMSGSFIEAATVWREHNEVSSGASDPPFSSVPFFSSPLGHENEWRASAQQSRIAFRAYGDIDPAQHMQAYYESDFLGAGVTANSRESNSYNLRVRQAWLSYDNDNAHFHMMAGQGWSMLTQNRVGITPLYENVPLTIDAQYVAGFNWARQEQLRFVEDWNKVAWFGVSVEAPQVNFPSNGVFPFSGASAAANTGGGTVPPGLVINDLNACNASGLLDSATACSNDVAPDIVEKFALDPGFGHYELVGLQRWFGDEVGTAALPNSWSQKVTMGWGAGGSALFPLFPRYLDFSGSVLTGQGIGRYGSSQLPDVTIGSTGALVPLQETEFLLELIGHPLDNLDVYAYYGQEQVNSNFWNIGATHGGYGNPLLSVASCATEDMVSGSVSASTGCAANAKRVQEVTVGFWNTLYKGDIGRFVWGMQYEYVQLTSFAGAPPTAAGLNPNNNIVFTSIRYYPFN